MTVKLLNKDASCYVCGRDNPQGLQVTFEPNGEKGSRAFYTVRPGHTGWPGLVHGGVLFMLMDEAVAWSLYYSNLRGVTAKAETRFRAPVPVGSPLIITGAIVECARNLVRAYAEVRRDDDSHEKLAELTATMFLLDDKLKKG